MEIIFDAQTLRHLLIGLAGEVLLIADRDVLTLRQPGQADRNFAAHVKQPGAFMLASGAPLQAALAHTTGPCRAKRYGKDLRVFDASGTRTDLAPAGN